MFFNLVIYSKLRGCDLVELKIGDLVSGSDILTRAAIVLVLFSGKWRQIGGFRKVSFATSKI